MKKSKNLLNYLDDFYNEIESILDDIYHNHYTHIGDKSKTHDFSSYERRVYIYIILDSIIF